MEVRKRQPIGIELVRRGIISEEDIKTALDYQRSHSKEKIGDILYKLKLCEPDILIREIGNILGQKGIVLKKEHIKLDVDNYISIELAKQYRAIPFEEYSGKIKVCFSDVLNNRTVEAVRLLMLNKGLVMETYITFGSQIDKILAQMGGAVSEQIKDSSGTTELVDSIIKTAMEKRASDIHFEPMENEVRVRVRIDGELFTLGTIKKEKQHQVIGRLKAISNMYQEKQESQDGRIIMYPDYNIRVSSQKAIYGEKFVLRLLKKNMKIQSLYELGFPENEELLKKAFNKRNSITIMAAPTGEGKTTSLYSIINYLDRPEINITTIEDPVEIRINGLNQIEIDANTNFSGSLRTVLRQDPDIILVGEIRDKETAEIAMQAGQTGHYVLSTIHTIDAIEVITRLRKMGVSDYDIASTLATSVSQRLVRRICPHCASQREFTEEEKNIINKITSRYNIQIDLNGKTTFEAVGCKQCNNIGYLDRIGVFEVLSLNDEIKEAITKGMSALEIRQIAFEHGYEPMVIDAIKKVVEGKTTLEEINRKLLIF